MAQITFTMSDDFSTRRTQAYCIKYDFANHALDGETEEQFANRMEFEQIKALVLEVESKQAITDAYTIQKDAINLEVAEASTTLDVQKNPTPLTTVTPTIN